MDKYIFTQPWFNDSEIKQLLLKFVDPEKIFNILEIGCFEGLSSVFFADNLLNHKDSRLTCVDPFLTTYNDHSMFLQNNEEARFDYNIKICRNTDRITVKKITSDEFFKTNVSTFNFIYIDGCHEHPFIKRDMENSFNFLEPGGIMWMDDYGSFRPPMDDFLAKYQGFYSFLYQGYQLAIIKT